MYFSLVESIALALVAWLLKNSSTLDLCSRYVIQSMFVKITHGIIVIGNAVVGSCFLITNYKLQII